MVVGCKKWKALDGDSGRDGDNWMDWGIHIDRPYRRGTGGRTEGGEDNGNQGARRISDNGWGKTGYRRRVMTLGGEKDRGGNDVGSEVGQ